jgi:CRP-like cAMP-binding protein
MTKEQTNSIRRVYHILSELPFFEEFSAEELNFFAKNLSLRSFPAGTHLFQQNDIGDYLFFVVNGEIEVKIKGHNVQQFIVAKFGSGSTIGEMSLIDDYPRSATILVAKPADLLLLTRQCFDRMCTEEPATGVKFLRGLTKTLSKRLRKANGRFADIA